MIMMITITMMITIDYNNNICRITAHVVDVVRPANLVQ
jgi:hypothetical protein